MDGRDVMYSEHDPVEKGEIAVLVCWRPTHQIRQGREEPEGVGRYD